MDSIDLSVALDVLNQKIAEFNMKIITEDSSEEIQKKLDKCLEMRQEVLNGNIELIKNIIDGNAGI